MKKDSTVCDEACVHRAAVAKARKMIGDDALFARLAEFYKALGDPTRAKILYALSVSELCVCDIAEIIGMSDSVVSHQLRILRNMRLVKHRKEGRSAFYSLDDRHIEVLLMQGMEHAKER